MGFRELLLIGSPVNKGPELLRPDLRINSLAGS
ncbi:MAG: hypothetical protein QOI57_2946 [Rubrobacteraceae bacterium]|nr:hypothetical protein [Rubrobacteraceae bacterium]